MAVGIGHRVAMSLRMSRYQKDGLKAISLAKAGISLAINVIGQDTATSDSLSDSWANNKEAFERIQLGDNSNEYASVSYTFSDEFNQPKIVYGSLDEESKININDAPAVLLTTLLTENGIDISEDLVNNILIWRGDAPDTEKVYEKSGYAPKGADFANIEELGLVKGMNSAGLQKISGLITACAGKVNINTALAAVLRIVFRSQVIFLNDNGVPDVNSGDAESLTQKLIAYRNGPDNLAGTGDDKVFSDVSNIGGTLELNEKERKVFDQAIQDNLVGVQSNFIRIESAGYVNNVVKIITALYDRSSGKISSWHEN
jgi:hypothetical protein